MFKKLRYGRNIHAGFTLVELAVVLVIIGLIMGMAIKGKSLIDVARLNAEVAKIRQLDTGITTYIAKVGGKENWGYYPSSGTRLEQPLYNAGVVTQRMFDLQYADIISIAGPVGAKVAILDCWKATGITPYGTLPWGHIWLFGGATTKHLDVCLYLSPSPRFLCGIETILDDKDVFGGDATFAGATFPTIIPSNAALDDCFELPKKAPYTYFPDQSIRVGI